MTPRNDLVFKKLFGSVGKENIVKYFLEAILDIKIKSLELGNETILLPEEIDERAGVLDVKATLENGTIIDIEMPKFLASKYNKKRKIDQWLLFLDYSRKELLREIMEENENIKAAEEDLKKIQDDKHAQYLAWLREKYILETNTSRVEGIEEAKKEIVIKMLKENFEISMISRISGLSEEEIEKIKGEME